MDLHGVNSGKNQERQRLSGERSNESGNVMIWIFICIALFAALSWAMSMNTRGGATTVSSQKADLIATEIIDYGRSVRNAVQTLQINGCDNGEISFEQSFVAGYNNPSAPTDESCHVFSGSGASTKWQSPPDNANDGSDYIFTGDNGVHWIGENGTYELLMILEDVNLEVCEELNRKFKNNFPIVKNTNTLQLDPFQGVYDDSGYIDDGVYSDVTIPCFENDVDTTLYYYHVLLVDAAPM